MFKDYLKYYFLEDYLFDEVSKNFNNRGYLTSEEFFAIIFWKRKASAQKIASKWNSKSIEDITKGLSEAKTREEKLKILTNIKEIGIAIASAILTVCYPKEYTVIDYRVKNSLKKLPIPINGNPENNIEDYLKYVDICKEKFKNYKPTLRDFDRTLWAMDFYDGEKGLVEIVTLYERTVK